jgi:hypothetical protein
MDPYFLQELSRIRRQEIDEEFKRIRLYRRMKANQPNLIGRVLKRFCSLLVAAGQVAKKVYNNPLDRRKNLLKADTLNKIQ